MNQLPSVVLEASEIITRLRAEDAQSEAIAVQVWTHFELEKVSGKLIGEARDLVATRRLELLREMLEARMAMSEAVLGKISSPYVIPIQEVLDFIAAIEK